LLISSITSENDILSLPVSPVSNERYPLESHTSSQASGQVDSLVPLLYLEHGDLQAAVDCAAKEVENGVHLFNLLAVKLRERFKGDKSIRDLEKMITGCQYTCTANLEWR